VLINSPANRRYLSGYRAGDHAPDESSGMLLITPTRALLFTSGVNADWARSEATSFEVVAIKRPWEPAIVENIVELGLRRIGFEDRGLVVSSHNAFAGSSSDIEWIPLHGAVDSLRAQKQPEEIAKLERALQLTDQVFAAVAASIVEGESEADVAWRIERLTRETTPGTVGFDPIVAVGQHAARPHHAPTETAIRAGEPIIIDMGVAFDGYCGDLTRTIWLGDPPVRTIEVYNIVRRAQEAAFSCIGPGVPVKAVDQAARDVLIASGFEDFIVHSVGHGLGLRVHEAPSVSINSKDVLQEGNVITIEPGVYFPDWGGVRIEDVALVSESGSRNLTTAAKLGD
jgi:Xaa-Pro aminopeptidase